MAESSRKRARVPKDVELIDLVDMEQEQKQQSISPNTESSYLPAAAWAKKRSNLWIKDATKFLSLEPSNVGAGNVAGDSQIDGHSQQDEVCVNIPLPKMLHSYAEYREKCVICYHRSRALQDAGMEQWMLSDHPSRDAVENTWPLGQGFFAVKFYSKSEAEKVLLIGEMPFYEGHVSVVPYIPSFFPTEESKQAWPAWISFPCLPLFLKPFVQDIASSLGKVVYAPEASGTLGSISPRVCILWDVGKEAPSTVKVSFDQLGTMKLAVKFDSIASHARPSQQGGENSVRTYGLAPLLPGNQATQENRSANAESLPLLLPVPAATDKVPHSTGEESPLCASPRKNEPCASPSSSHQGNRFQFPPLDPMKESKSPISTRSVPLLRVKVMSGCPGPSVDPFQTVHPLSSGSQCKAVYGEKYVFGGDPSTTYNNVLFQPKKSKVSGQELAVVAPRYHAMKELDSNSQVSKQMPESRKHAVAKYTPCHAGKENHGTKKDAKFDKENGAARKNPKAEESSVSLKGKNGSSF